MIKAVIFDADGVVIFPWRFSRFLEQEHAITPKMTSAFFKREFEDCLIGQRDLYEALAPYLSRWNWKGSLNNFIATWFEMEAAVDSRVLNLIQSLNRRGFTCCLASNQERYRAEYMRNVMGFSQLFYRLYFSCDLGCQKPDNAYYRRIEKSLEMSGSSLLFWDDSPPNVKGARECGWNAEVYTGFEDFQHKLSAYLP